MNREALGRRLRELRTDRRLSQAKLAERAGTSMQTVSRIERAQLEPSLTMASNLANALGVDLDYLAAFSEDARERAVVRTETSASTKKIIRLVERLTPRQRDALLIVLRALEQPRKTTQRAGRASGKTERVGRKRS